MSKDKIDKAKMFTWEKKWYLYSYWCIECGKEWAVYTDDVDDETCPVCGSKNLDRYH